MHWYDDLPHIGYDIDGKKVLRPARGDELDKFLKTVEDPEAWCDNCHVIESSSRAEATQDIRVRQEHTNGQASYARRAGHYPQATGE